MPITRRFVSRKFLSRTNTIAPKSMRATSLLQLWYIGAYFWLDFRRVMDNTVEGSCGPVSKQEISVNSVPTGDGIACSTLQKSDLTGIAACSVLPLLRSLPTARFWRRGLSRKDQTCLILVGGFQSCDCYGRNVCASTILSASVPACLHV
jgi:hypothetical protein